jgi:hypothetical protein
MAAAIQVTKPGKYRNIVNPSTVVEVVTEAECRTGEMHGRCVIYTRGKKFYVRSIGEFAEKFRPVEG